MKKVFALLTMAVFLFIAAGAAHADSLSAKTAVCNNQVCLMKTSVGVLQTWVPVLRASLHTSSQKDLVVTPSLECALYTDTKASTKGGVTSGATATAKIRVRVVVDGNTYAIPSAVGNMGVAYCERTQTLSATLQGIISMCSDVNLDGYIDPNTECTLSDESVQLILDTMSAHAFSFLVPNVGVGDHEVVVEAMIDTSTDTFPEGSSSTANATASIGMGTVIVDEVRLAAGNNISM